MTEQLIDIGKRLFALRDACELTAAEMAAKLNMSEEEYAAFEAGGKDFSFSFLYSAAGILGVDVFDIISGESPRLSRCTIIKNGQGYDIARREAYDYKHLAFTFRNKKAEPFMVTIEPKPAETEPDKHSHMGQEFDYIVSGAIKFYLDNDVYELTEGDSIYFDSGILHAMRAVGDKPAKFLAVVMK